MFIFIIISSSSSSSSSSITKRKGSNKRLDKNLTPDLQVALLSLFLLLLNRIFWRTEVKFVLQNWGGRS